MSHRKTVTVFGATGTQGRSVIYSLLGNSSDAFTLRGISRDTNSDASRSLKAKGVHMVQADGFIKEQVLNAVKGSWGLFVNTNSDDPTLHQDGGPTEMDLGTTVVDAAFEAGVECFIYSGMASASIITDGTIPNACFDEKHAIGEYAKQRGFQSVVIVSPGWYLENHLNKDLARIFGGFPFESDREGYLTLRWPFWGGNGQLPMIAVEDDFGDLIHGVMLEPKPYKSQFIQGISQSATPEELVQAFENVTGKKCRFEAVDDWRDFDTRGRRSLETTKKMFGYCQYSGGLYYGVPNDTTVAAELKTVAARAQCKPKGTLLTLEGFFRKHFKVQGT